MKKMMIVVAGVAATLAFVASAAPKPKALVVMLDGCRADALENATAPNIWMLAEGRWQPGYRAAWTRTACTILDGRLYWIAEDAKNMRLDSGLPFCIGQDGTGCYKHQFNGDIDDFALWTRALSHDDVRRIFESGRQGIPLAELL